MLEILLRFWRYCFSPQATEHQYDDESDSSEEDSVIPNQDPIITHYNYESIKGNPGYISFDSLGGKSGFNTEH